MTSSITTIPVIPTKTTWPLTMEAGVSTTGTFSKPSQTPTVGTGLLNGVWYMKRMSRQSERLQDGWWLYGMTLKSEIARSEWNLFDGITKGTPDFRKHRKYVEEECYAESRCLNQLGFGSKNPYSKGGKGADWNPSNGQPKQSQAQSFHRRPLVPNQHTYSNVRGSYGGRGVMREGQSGYSGPPELFEPKFTEKRASASKS